MRAIFSSHERIKLYNFGGLEAQNLGSANAGPGNAILVPDWFMSPFTPSGKKVTGFQFAVHTYPFANSVDPRDNSAVNWTDSAGGAGYGITVWRLDGQTNRWAQFKKLTGLLIDEAAVTSDLDASELFFQFDPATLANAAGSVLVSFLEL